MDVVVDAAAQLLTVALTAVCADIECLCMCGCGGSWPIMCTAVALLLVSCRPAPPSLVARRLATLALLVIAVLLFTILVASSLLASGSFVERSCSTRSVVVVVVSFFDCSTSMR